MAERTNEPAPTAKPKPVETEKKPETKTKKASGLKKWAITIGVSLLVAVVCYGIGFVHGASGKAELEAAAETAANQARLLEARRRLDLAHIELENQNFGHAESHLRAAAQKLDAAEPEGAMAELAADVAETRIGVTDDIAAQQQQIRQLIARFDQLHRPAQEQSATPAP